MSRWEQMIWGVCAVAILSAVLHSVCRSGAMKEAVRAIGGRALVEISGNVTAENAARLKDIGADIVSCGALTHSAPILDVSLKNLHPVGREV